MTFAEFAAAYGLVTGSASVIGLIVAFIQLKQVDTKAKTAEATAKRVEDQLQDRSVLYELSSCGQAVKDARNYIRLGLAQSALYRIEGLASRLSSIKKLSWFEQEERGSALGKALYGVALVRTALDGVVCDGHEDIDPEDARGHVKRLGAVEDQLNEWIGELRFTQEER